MSENTTTILEWDSNFFKRKIASISIYTWDETFLDNTLQRYKKENFSLVYLFLQNGIQLPDIYFHKYKCNLVDKKRIYTFNSIEKKELPPNIILYKGDACALYDLAIQAGVDSRYHTDPDFPQTDFERLYKAWIDNSLKGIMADYVLVYRMSKGELGGLITLKKRKKYLSIGLVATDLAYRRSGIGSALMNAAKQYAYINNLFLEVVTQADNIPACSFYEKHGFGIQSQSMVYHIWL